MLAILAGTTKVSAHVTSTWIGKGDNSDGRGYYYKSPKPYYDTKKYGSVDVLFQQTRSRRGHNSSCSENCSSNHYTAWSSPKGYKKGELGRFVVDKKMIPTLGARMSTGVKSETIYNSSTGEPSQYKIHVSITKYDDFNNRGLDGKSLDSLKNSNDGESWTANTKYEFRYDKTQTEDPTYNGRNIELPAESLVERWHDIVSQTIYIEDIKGNKIFNLNINNSDSTNELFKKSSGSGSVNLQSKEGYSVTASYSSQSSISSNIEYTLTIQAKDLKNKKNGNLPYGAKVYVDTKYVSSTRYMAESMRPIPGYTFNSSVSEYSDFQSQVNSECKTKTLEKYTSNYREFNNLKTQAMNSDYFNVKKIYTNHHQVGSIKGKNSNYKDACQDTLHITQIRDTNSGSFSDKDGVVKGDATLSVSPLNVTTALEGGKFVTTFKFNLRNVPFKATKGNKDTWFDNFRLILEINAENGEPIYKIDRYLKGEKVDDVLYNLVTGGTAKYSERYTSEYLTVKIEDLEASPSQLGTATVTASYSYDLHVRNYDDSNFLYWEDRNASEFPDGDYADSIKNGVITWGIHSSNYPIDFDRNPDTYHADAEWEYIFKNPSKDNVENLTKEVVLRHKNNIKYTFTIYSLTGVTS